MPDRRRRKPRPDPRRPVRGGAAPGAPALLATLCALSLAACGGQGEPALDLRFEAAGPYAAANKTLTLTDAARGRTLTVEVWYPTEGALAAGAPAEELLADPAERAAYASLLAAAPAGCPSLQTHALREAPPLAGASLPLLVFSHCHNCVRFSSFSIAERLASHGFVVAAPDHAGNTLFDFLAGTAVELDAAFLPVRAADLSFVIDRMLAGDGGVDVDAARIGVYGHSFGAVTAGLVLQDDPRPVAGFAIASPMENPLLQGVEIDRLAQPLGFLLAVEDNSITELGNLFIRRNFDEAPGPAWKGEVADAGHWSFSDICGLHEQFGAGCGTAERQTDNTPFAYLPVADGLAIAQAYVTAFFSAHLLGDASAVQYLGAARFAAHLTIEER